MRKIFTGIIGLSLLAFMLAACAKKGEEDNFTAVVAISLTQTAVAQQQPAETPPTAAPAATGVINGRAHLMSPPTPHMTIYALDVNNGEWVSTDAAPAEGPASFTLVVPPGSYRIYGFSDGNDGVAYSVDDKGLTVVDVAANQTVADVVLRLPGRFECGPMYAIPASPDNRFSAVPGPEENCQAALQAADALQASAAQPQRVQFAPGAVSTRIQEVIPAAGRRYVLTAMVGQEMTVYLSTPGNTDASPFFFVIRGADGTVLATPEQRLTQWSGTLPSTQDYTIDLVSLVQAPADCTLDIAIAALQSASQDMEVYPQVIPAGFESLTGLSRNVMLPARFPVTGGVPALAPYVLWAENGGYDVSLDYGAECRGAGACHYGSLSVMKIYAADPQSTPNFVYDAGSAKYVTLADGIPGYYLEGQCGASCDDSRLFWIYDGYQYMVGLKGAQKDALIDLANAAIDNSLP